MSTPPGAEDKTAQCDPPKRLLDGLIISSPEHSPCPAPAAANDASATSYGPYKLGKKLGEGGFGAVYEAEQQHPVKRRVALKLIKLGMDTQEVIARFEAERQALAMMEHPNIARVLDVGASDSGRPYFVMELVQGEPISSYCDKHQLSIVERLELFDQLCQAVQHAHTKGVIHRDLKPSNVLVSSEHDQPLAKVIDFGIAKATSGHLTDRGLLTEQLQMIGTPLYMSPEQAQGGADIDTRTDIYSLGVLLYQLLTDSTPFESTTLRMSHYAEILRIICEVDPPRPSTRLGQSEDTLIDVANKRRIEPRKLIKKVRGELDWIVMKAIEKDRSRRYETANALASDVRRYLAGQPLLAAPPSAVYRLRKFVRRNQLAVGAGLMVAASLVVGIVAFAWQAKIAQQQARIAEQQAHIAQQRTAELEQVAKFSADMLGLVEPTEAGRLLSSDIAARLEEALTKAGVPESERAAQAATFARLWRQVNATDTARTLIDSTILKPAIGAIDQRFKDQPVVDATLREVLANRYASMGLYDAALPLQERALAIRRRVLGGEHPDTLVSIASLGELLQSQGKLSEAESHLRAVLEKSRRVLGEEHPQTLQAINNLGNLLLAQGKFSEAEPYLREGLEKRRRVLGAEHPDTVISISTMGSLLRVQGKLSEAEPYLREALEKDRRVLGEADPLTMASINTMGDLLQAQGKLSEAEPYYREGLEKRRRVLGAEHPDTLISISRMALLREAQGEPAEAVELLVPIETATREAFNGGNAFRLARFLTTMGKARTSLGQFSAAEAKLLEAHGILMLTPGPFPQEPRDCTQAIVDLYIAWHAAEPGKGYAAKAGEWKQKLIELGAGGSAPVTPKPSS